MAGDMTNATSCVMPTIGPLLPGGQFYSKQHFESLAANSTPTVGEPLKSMQEEQT